MAYTDVKFKFKSVGKNVEIGSNVYFRYPELVSLGDNVIIDDFCYFTTSLDIGNFVHIGPHCSVIGGKDSKLIMRDFSGFSAGCRIICSSDDYTTGLTNPCIPQKYRSSGKSGIVELKKHAVLGTNTIIQPHVTLEEGAATGSGTLVRENLDPWSIYVGSPARKINKRDRESILTSEKEFIESLKN
jgi:acetyltransferase-like isoleucine patch superfamily enzyme